VPAAAVTAPRVQVPGDGGAGTRENGASDAPRERPCPVGGVIPQAGGRHGIRESGRQEATQATQELAPARWSRRAPLHQTTTLHPSKLKNTYFIIKK